MLFTQFADASGLSPADSAKRISMLEARLALAERTAGMGTLRWAINEDAPDWSPGLYRILGLDPSKPPLPGALFHMAHPDDKEIFARSIRSVQDAPGPFYLSFRVIRADGAERHIEVSGDVETSEDGELIAIVALVTDVSKRIETEDQLRGAIDAFRVLTEEANDLICRHDSRMGILYCSPAITRMLGYDPSEVLGAAFTGIIHPDDLPELGRVHRELLQPGAFRTITLRMRHKDGHDLWVETVCRSVGEPDTARVNEIITVSRDVTARKIAEIEINKARETAESANRTKSRFLATMSHELRTPLNAVIGFSDMIKSQLFGSLNPRYREYSELIHESGTLLLDLINDLLDMSKIEAGRFELALETFDLTETVQSCVRMLKSKSEAAGLKLEIDIAGAAPVEADKRAIKQVLLNLMSNAIKFTPRGGTITLSAKECGDRVSLCVSDTGVGIPAIDLPRLGRPFEQVTHDATLAKSGTGLGLALVSSLAQLHGGEMLIQSQEGRGTRATVLLPKHRMAVAA